MSTKIYDAYRFKHKYSMNHLDKVLMKWRMDINEMAKTTYARFSITNFVYFYDMLTLHGVEHIKKLEAMSQDDRTLTQIYHALVENETFKLKIRIDDMLSEKIKNKNSGLSRMFKSEICIYPIKHKLLFMYFGNPDYQKYIESQRIVLDYHYQNQCDKPDDITDRAWEKRNKDWKKAIGDDYVPINHGFTVNFLNDTDVYFSLFNEYLHNDTLKSELFPDMKTRVKAMIETCDDYPNPPEDKSYSSWCKYQATQEYIDWAENKTIEIEEKLHPDMISVYKQKELIK